MQAITSTVLLSHISKTTWIRYLQTRRTQYHSLRGDQPVQTAISPHNPLWDEGLVNFKLHGSAKSGKSSALFALRSIPPASSIEQGAGRNLQVVGYKGTKTFPACIQSASSKQEKKIFQSSGRKITLFPSEMRKLLVRITRKAHSFCAGMDLTINSPPAKNMWRLEMVYL